MDNYKTLVEKVIKENIDEIPDADDFKSKCLNDSKLIEDFCEMYKVKLVSIDFTAENTTPEATVFEPMYYFDDNLGGYTKEGLESSLTEKDSLAEK